MIIFKALSIEELRKDYLDKRGFIFQGPSPSSDNSIQQLCDVLISKNITTVYPEFVVKLDNITVLFIYGDDFDTPAFYQKAMIACQMSGVKIETLYNFLKQ